MYVGSVVIDSNDFAAMYAFSRAVLGYVPRDPPEDGWAVLSDPDGTDVNVSLQQAPEPRLGKNVYDSVTIMYGHSLIRRSR